jgi:hypothetical protein
MKNHFYFAYVGNKREEVERIIESTKTILETDGITTIIEPYCGSSAISYYISSLYPGKFKYILNDNDTNLINLYKLVKSKKYKKLEKKVNKLIIEFNKFETNETRKQFYDSLKKVDNLENWLFMKKFYCIRAGLCPLIETKKQLNEFKINEFPITKFLLTENITFLNGDASELITTHKDDKTKILILDPPYMQTCNDFYANKNLNIYEYLYYNNINQWKAKAILILENIWINKLLFATNKVSDPYSKNYQTSQKKTEHIIITQV